MIILIDKPAFTSLFTFRMRPMCCYDNLKSAVLERVGQTIRFDEKLLRMAGHYRLAPKPCAPYRGNEKGRVERRIRYIRDNFFAARKWRDLDDLNVQAAAWCDNIAASRPCPGDRSKTVREACNDSSGGSSRRRRRQLKRAAPELISSP